MGIHQLSVTLDERQDRLFLRVNTQEGQEIKFWLTRRMVARLLPALEHAIGTLETQRTEVIAPDIPSRQMLTEIQREVFVQQADFVTPYVPPPSPQLPLAEVPLLVTDAQLTVQAQQLQLVLQDQSEPQGRQCQMQLPTSLVHGLRHLIEQAMVAADWGLGTSVTSSSETVPLDMSQDNPRYTH